MHNTAFSENGLHPLVEDIMALEALIMEAEENGTDPSDYYHEYDRLCAKYDALAATI